MPQRDKLAALRERLAQTGTLSVAFSGGVDSQLLVRVAADVLGPESVVALTARGVNFPEHEYRDALAFARRLGVRQVVVDFDPLAIPEFVDNGPERCYHCKRALFQALRAAAREEGAPLLADGANRDDAGDYRPGQRAAAELGVMSPLRDAGLDKADIRRLLRELGVPAWDKPSFACLASRVPYGQRITAADLGMIERGEEFFRERGFHGVRVRLHGNLARVEVAPDERSRFFDPAFLDEAGQALAEMGFAYSALDFLGYRRGSLNETLRKEER